MLMLGIKTFAGKTISKLSLSDCEYKEVAYNKSTLCDSTMSSIVSKFVRFTQTDVILVSANNILIDQMTIYGLKSKKSKLGGLHIKNCTIMHASPFANVSVCNSIFHRLTINEGVLSGVNFNRVAFIDCLLSNVKIVETSFDECTFSGCGFNSCSFENNFLGQNKTFNRCHFKPAHPLGLFSQQKESYPGYDNIPVSTNMFVNGYATKGSSLISGCYGGTNIVISGTKLEESIKKQNIEKKKEFWDRTKNKKMAYFFGTSGTE